VTHDVAFKLNCASESEIANHLRHCDQVFVPSLSSRVSIDAYATKLFQRAQRFEAWHDIQMMGLVAVYCNDPMKHAAFITSVSICPCYQGMGFANKLLSNCIHHLKAQSFIQIELEVACHNTNAVKLYRKLGFIECHANDLYITMTLPL